MLSGGSHREPHGAKVVSKTRENVWIVSMMLVMWWWRWRRRRRWRWRQDAKSSSAALCCAAPCRAHVHKTRTHAHKATTTDERASERARKRTRRTYISDGGTVNSIRSTFRSHAPRASTMVLSSESSAPAAWRIRPSFSSCRFRVLASTHLNRHTH